MTILKTTLRKGDIVTASTGETYEIEEIIVDPRWGEVANCRLYRSQVRHGIRCKGLKKHPLFS
jgi:hypothetical protein